MTTEQLNQSRSEWRAELTAGLLEEAIFAVLPELETRGAGVSRLVTQTRDWPGNFVRIEVKAVGLPGAAVTSSTIRHSIPRTMWKEPIRERRIA